MKWRAVIFDLFGTLIDNMRYSEYRRMLAEMAAILGIADDDFSREWTATVDDRFKGKFKSIEDNLSAICRNCGRDVEVASVAASARVRLDFTREMMVPRADAVDTIQTIRDRGAKVGLISDCTPETPVHWRASPFPPLFDATVFSSEVGLKKPDPKIFATACEWLGVVPVSCLYVGDGGSGELTAAAGFGMTSILIMAQPAEDMLGHRTEAATWTGPMVKSLSEVLKYC